MIQILVLDPHPIIHLGFITIFTCQPKINLLPGIYKHKQLDPTLKNYSVDLLIMELDLLNGSPVSILKYIASHHPNIKTIIFSHQPVNVFALSLLKAGAHGYLSKRTPSNLLIEAIQFVTNKGEKVISKHHNELEYKINLNRPRNKYGELSPREIEILRHLIDGKRNITIAEELNISQKTVNTYKNRILEKLGTNNFHELYTQTKLFIPN